MDLKEAEIFKNNDKGRRHPWEMTRFEVVLSLIRRKFPQRDPVILDIGCGDAFILEMMSKKLPGAKLIGIDTGFDQTAVDRYSAQYPNVGFYSSFESMTGVRSAPVDIVLMLDVLEHISDDVGVLKSIASSPVISKDTLFFIAVPAFQSIFSSHDEWLGHYRRYNIKQLSQKADQAGFKILETGYFFTSLLLLRTIKAIRENLSKRPGRTKQNVSIWKGNGFLDAVIKVFLFLDYQLAALFNKTGLKIPGLSCYMVCQKRGL